MEMLEAGDLSLRLDGSDVRSLSWGGVEVLQRVYYAVRDAPWNTVPGVIEELSVTRRPTDFAALVRQRHRFDDIDLDCELAIAGTAEGTFTMTATTTTRAAFQYSKIGLNLHHGMRTYRGASGRARTLDGWTPFAFADEIVPQLISGDTLTAMFAHFDALDIDLPGLTASLVFAGDRFEMQDHRNWCDANWKTYGTPLEYGFPMDCAAGQQFTQTVTVTMATSGGPVAGRQRRSGHDDVAVTLGDVDGKLPSVGVDASAAPGTSGTASLDAVAALGVDFVRLTFDGHDDERAAAALRRLGELGVPAEAVVLVDSEDPSSVERLVAALESSPQQVGRIVCLAGGSGFSAFRGATPATLVVTLADALAGSPLAAVPIFSGANQSYNVIARDRPEYPPGVGIVFAGNPQVHACDDESVMQNAAAFADVVRDGRRLSPARPIAISPVHLISDSGPFPAGPPSSPTDRPQDDPRYDTSFAAAWSIAMLAAVSSERADAVCLFDATGRRGVTHEDGTLKPVAAVLSLLRGRHGAPTRSAAVSSPDEVAVLDVGEGAARIVLVANLCSEWRVATVRGLASGDHRVPLEPFAIVELR